MLEGYRRELRTIDTHLVLNACLLTLSMGVESLIGGGVHTRDRSHGYGRGATMDVGACKAEPGGHVLPHGLDVGIGVCSFGSDERVVEARESVSAVGVRGQSVFRVLGWEQHEASASYLVSVGCAYPMGS